MHECLPLFFGEQVTALQPVRSQPVLVAGAEIFGSNVKHRLGAGHPFRVHAVRGSCCRGDDGAGEFRIGIQLQAVFDDMLVLAGLSGIDHRAAVWKSAVRSFHLILGDEGDGGIVIGEVVRHLLDLFFDACLVGAFLNDYVALTRVLLAGMPVATNGLLFCLRYGGNLKAMTQGVFLSTAMSVLTIPCLALLLALV